MMGNHLWGWTSFSLTTPEGITLYQKTFWFYAGPASIGLILLALGVIFEVLIARSRATVHLRTAIASSGVAISMLAIVSWSQHLATTADGEFTILLGSFFGLLMVLPASFILLQLLRLTCLLKRPVTGSVLFAFSAVVCGLLAGIAGTALAIPALAIHLHNTYFTVAHLHLALAGSIGGAIFAGLFHFWPQWWQTSYSERMARASAFGMLGGIGLAFLPMALIGAQGLPRALYVYPVQFHILHTISSIGSFLLVGSFILALITLAGSLRLRGEAKLTTTPPSGEFTYGPIFPEATRR